MLVKGGRAAPWLSLAPLPPEEGLLPPAQPFAAVLLDKHSGCSS